MCNKVATPEYDELHGYFDKQAVNHSKTFKVGAPTDYPHYYQADSFLRPYLPIVANDNSTVHRARWKLLPYWVKNEEEAKKYANTFNARSEDIFTTSSYKNYIAKNRCLLWVSGFYEPNHPAKKVTVPYFVKSTDNSPLALGCVYADWTDQDTGEVTRTISIITTPPNELLKQVHNEGQRMPFIVTPGNWQRWLGPLSKEEISEMMQPLPDGHLQAYPVDGIIYKNRGLNTPETQVQVPVSGSAF